MWCIRQRLWHSSLVILVCSLILAGGFIVHLHTLYVNHQRYLRLEGYKKDIEKLSEDMETIKRVGNVSSKLLKKIENLANDEAHKNMHKLKGFFAPTRFITRYLDWKQVVSFL